MASSKQKRITNLENIYTKSVKETLNSWNIVTSSEIAIKPSHAHAYKKIRREGPELEVWQDTEQTSPPKQRQSGILVPVLELQCPEAIP